MLGDKLFDSSLYVLVAVWITGFLLTLSLLYIKKVFPKFEESIDLILLISGKIILIAMELSLLIAIILMAAWWFYSA
jgi:hypothetical protein